MYVCVYITLPQGQASDMHTVPQRFEARASDIQGYLTHKKLLPPRNLEKAYA